MKAVKRVELIIETPLVKHVTELLNQINISGYTVIRDAYGHGDRGDRGGDMFGSTFDNSYVLIACTEVESQQIVDVLRPLLKQHGGVCLISDAQWLVH